MKPLLALFAVVLSLSALGGEYLIDLPAAGVADVSSPLNCPARLSGTLADMPPGCASTTPAERLFRGRVSRPQ